MVAWWVVLRVAMMVVGMVDSLVVRLVAQKVDEMDDLLVVVLAV